MKFTFQIKGASFPFKAYRWTFAKEFTAELKDLEEAFDLARKMSTLFDSEVRLRESDSQYNVFYFRPNINTPFSS